MKFELDANIYERIKSLSQEGDEFQHAKNYEKAINKYNEAFLLIPEPKTSWAASTWILTAIGETFFFMKKYQEAKQSLIKALGCPGGKENPFIHLRLGQTYFELNKVKEAKRELNKARALDTYNSLFKGEDNKYYDLIKKQ